ncbi:MAG: hypothetical protein U0R80_19025 [Nocardioidaceae bacterium]
MASGAGKRSGARRGAKRPVAFRADVAVLAVLFTLAVVAWGFLVWFAIDFGTRARGGESQAWWLMAATAVGAVACLFVALMLVARLARALGITSSHATSAHAGRRVAPVVEEAPPYVVPAAPPPGAAPAPEAAAPPPLPGPVVELGDTAERPAIRHGRHEA